MALSSDDLRALIREREVDLRQPGAVLFSRTRYEIDRVLGEGGMGITCLAHEVSAANLQRPVVLKFVKDSLDSGRMDRFLNEVQLSILFNHPNLVPVYRLESENLCVALPREKGSRQRKYEHTVYFAVMQYIDGWNLREIVQRLRALNILLHHDITMFILARIARGLNYVHEYRDENGEYVGLVHRDVSPENILIDRFGRIKVADFGIAKTSKALRDDSMVHAGKMLYSSPEQLAGGKLDARSDIYNVGLLMYFLFTNNDRFGPEWGQARVRDRIRTKMKKVPKKALANVEPELATICQSCLSEDPGRRYQTCEDLATDIEIYFKNARKIVTNDQLEEVLGELFKDNPTFTSRRFIPLTGSPHLEQPGYDPSSVEEPQPVEGALPTVRLDEE